MTDVELQLEMHPCVGFVAMTLVDRYLDLVIVPSKTLQLVGVAALLLAVKFEGQDVWFDAREAAYYTDGAYTAAEVCDMERKLLATVGYSWFTQPTVWTFVTAWVPSATTSQKTMKRLLYFAVAVRVYAPDLWHSVSPPRLAAAVLCLGSSASDPPPCADNLAVVLDLLSEDVVSGVRAAVVTCAAKHGSNDDLCAEFTQHCDTTLPSEGRWLII